MKHVILLLVLLLGCVACERADSDKKEASQTSERQVSQSANTEKHEYPSESRDAFLDSCTEASGGLRAPCVCLFDEIRTEYSYEEFVTIELKMQFSEPPEDFLNFMGGATARCQQ